MNKKKNSFQTALLYQEDLEAISLNCNRCEQEYASFGYYDEELEYYIEVSHHRGTCDNCLVTSQRTNCAKTVSPDPTNF